jgi:hypothetical protein
VGEHAPSFGRDERLAAFALAVLLATQLWGRPLAWGFGIVVATLLPAGQFARARRHPARTVRSWGSVGLLALVSALAATIGFRAGVDPQLRWIVVSAYVAVVATVHAALRLAQRTWRAEHPARGATLSVGIICFNEADRLPACLEVLRGWPDEIVVVDSGSDDGTAAVARRYTDAVIVTDWPGDGPQKRRLVDRCTSDWVLVLDADEIATEEFKRDVDAAIAAKAPFAAYDFPWIEVVFGRQVYFGAVGHRFARLFRRGAVRFGDEALHAVPAVEGDVGSLAGPVFHRSYRDAAHLERKNAGYARSAARMRHARGARVTATGVALRSVGAFITAYVIRLGMLDGTRGALMAFVHSRYTFDKYAALRSLGRGRDD